MKLNQEQVFGCYPELHMLMRSAERGLPAIMNVSGDCVAGNSSGWHQQAFPGALGEYVERYHFYNEVDINVTQKLPINSKWLHVIKQMQAHDQDACQHEFDLTLVKNIATKQTAYVPSAFISMGQLNVGDRDFIPFIDSSGQAAHVNPKYAFRSAFNEFIERQGLIGAWLSGKAVYQIELCSLPELGNSRNILERLQAHGELLAFDLANSLPGYGVIIFYFSKSKQDKVRYSVGMAASDNSKNAVVNALNELWQSYVFVYLNADNAENLDERYQYLNDLLGFNQHQTRDLIPFIDVPCMVDLASYLKAPQVDEFEKKLQLQQISMDVYAYEQQMSFYGRRFHFCKILSPDFFVHMGIQKPLNFDNAYATLLNIKRPQQILHPIPFP